MHLALLLLFAVALSLMLTGDTAIVIITLFTGSLHAVSSFIVWLSYIPALVLFVFVYYSILKNHIPEDRSRG